MRNVPSRDVEALAERMGAKLFHCSATEHAAVHAAVAYFLTRFLKYRSMFQMEFDPETEEVRAGGASVVVCLCGGIFHHFFPLHEFLPAPLRPALSPSTDRCSKWSLIQRLRGRVPVPVWWCVFVCVCVWGGGVGD